MYACVYSRDALFAIAKKFKYYFLSGQAATRWNESCCCNVTVGCGVKKTMRGKKFLRQAKKLCAACNSMILSTSTFAILYCSSNNRLGERGRGEREAKESKISFLFDIERNEV